MTTLAISVYALKCLAQRYAIWGSFFHFLWYELLIVMVTVFFKTIILWLPMHIKS